MPRSWDDGVVPVIGYQLALELVQLIGKTRIADARLREQARKSAASAALNAAEGAARRSTADKSRAFAIAVAEACEEVAAVEIAPALGTWTQRSAQQRGAPWKDLLRALERTLLALTVEQLGGLRPRRLQR